MAAESPLWRVPPDVYRNVMRAFLAGCYLVGLTILGLATLDSLVHADWGAFGSLMLLFGIFFPNLARQHKRRAEQAERRKVA